MHLDLQSKIIELCKEAPLVESELILKLIGDEDRREAIRLSVRYFNEKQTNAVSSNNPPNAIMVDSVRGMFEEAGSARARYNYRRENLGNVSGDIRAIDFETLSNPFGAVDIW